MNSANRLQEFVAETGVFLLRLQKPQLSRREKIFWLLVTIIFAAVTVRDLILLIESFAAEETLTLVVPRMDDSVVFEPPPSGWIILRDETLFQNFTTNLSLIQYELQEFRSALVEHNCIKDCNHSFELNDELFQINLAFVSQVFRIEFDAIANTAAEYNLIDGVILAQKFYAKHNISMTVLQKITGAALCEKTQLKVEYFDFLTHIYTEMGSVCQPDLVTNIVGYEFGLKLSSKPVTFQYSYKALAISFDPSAIQLMIVDLGGLVSYWSVELSGSEIRMDAAETPELLPSRPCHTESNADCQVRCGAELFYACAGCWPMHFPLRMQKQNASVCPGNSQLLELQQRLSNFTKCFGAKIGGSEFWSGCNQKCTKGIPPCELRSFTHFSERKPLKNSSRSEYRLYIQSFLFPIFEEKLKLTFETFLSRLGGSLGLYLGLSFASILHIPIFCIRQLSHFLHQKFAEKNVCPINVEMNPVVLTNADQILLLRAEFREEFKIHSTRFDLIEQKLNDLYKTVGK